MIPRMTRLDRSIKARGWSACRFIDRPLTADAIRSPNAVTTTDTLHDHGSHGRVTADRPARTGRTRASHQSARSKVQSKAQYKSYTGSRLLVPHVLGRVLARAPETKVSKGDPKYQAPVSLLVKLGP